MAKVLVLSVCRKPSMVVPISQLCDRVELCFNKLEDFSSSRLMVHVLIKFLWCPDIVSKVLTSAGGFTRGE